MAPLEDEDHAEITRLRKLLPAAARKAMGLMGKSLRVRRSDRSAEHTSELYDELLSVAEEMLVEQWPKVNEGIIRSFLHLRLFEWHQDNQESVTAVKADTNRQRNSRYRKWCKANPSQHDPRERPHELPGGLKADYASRVYPDLDALVFACGQYAPHDDYTYSVADKEISAVHTFYNLLYIFVADDQTDRDIITYLRQRVSVDDPKFFLELEKVSKREIAEEIGVSRAAVDRRIKAMRQRLLKIKLRGIKSNL